MFKVGISRPSSYAVRALAFLAAQPKGKLCAKDEIAAGESIPPAFLGKVLLPLCRDRIIRSRKGSGGGYELVLPPEKIHLLFVVRSIEGEPLRDCLLEDRACASDHPCELHTSWSRMRDELLNYLERVTLADVLKARQDRAPVHAGAASGAPLENVSPETE